MSQYKRNWPCGICGAPVIVDLEEGTISCDCGTSAYPRPDAHGRKVLRRDYMRIRNDAEQNRAMNRPIATLNRLGK